MRTTSKDSNRIVKRISISVVIVSVILLVVLVCQQLLTGTEEHSSAKVPDSTINLVTCTATNPKDAFFEPSSTVTGGSHEIKITSAKNSEADEIFYTYITTYATDEDATRAEARLHALYNQGLTASNGSKLSPTFSAVGNKLQITLFGTVSKLNSILAKPFFITEEEFKSISNFDVPTLTELYQSKGFTCASQK